MDKQTHRRTIQTLYAPGFSNRGHKKRTDVDGEMSVYWTIVFGLHKRYSDGRESLNGDERSGRPLNQKALLAVNQVRLMLEQDHGKIIS